jgi:hypothetical protein
MHLHVDLPQRQPLLLSKRLLLADEEALDLPFDIEFVKVGSKREGDSFQFTLTERGENDALIVHCAFAPEGLGCRFTLRSGNDGWTVLEREVWEN